MWLIVLLFFAIVFYILRKSSETTLLSIVVVGMMGVVFYYIYVEHKRTAPKQPTAESDTNERREVVSESYELKRFTNKLKYIHENAEFKDIARDLRFTRIFDKARYGDLLVHMDKLQKVYVYILGGRYDPRLYIPTFIDLRRIILEILYSFFMVVPQELKHTYNLDPYKQLYDNIESSTVATRKMLNVLYAYAKAHGYNVVDDYLTPYEETRNNILP